MGKELEIKKEQIYQSYSKTFDKDLAYSKVLLSESEKKILENDLKFQARLKNALIEMKEQVIAKIREYMDSEDERISFKATTELAMVLYPEFFDVAQRKTKPNSSILEQMDETDIESLIREEAKNIAKSNNKN